MRLHNIRYGFATNSSSTHSFVFLDHSVETSTEHSDFGWEFFTLADRESKLDYLAATIKQNTPGEASQEYLRDLLREPEFIDPDSTIDHQSILTLPKTWLGLLPDREFISHLKKFILQERLALLGGNDNDDVDHPLGGSYFPLPVEREGKWVSRWDPVYKYWSLFSTKTGQKIRMDFEELENGGLTTQHDYVDEWDPQINKAFAPELVDLKITETCTNTKAPCFQYCYQQSKPGGRHCDLDSLRKIAESFADLKIFEVALGGGDPLDHPDLLEILRLFKAHGITPSLSTRKTEWLKDLPFREAVFSLVGAVGFSINSAKEVSLIESLIKDLIEEDYYFTDKVKFHYVMGSTPLSHLADILEYFQGNESSLQTSSILLLGYKQTGRGAGFAQHPYDALMDILAEHKVWKICADTSFLSEFRKKIQEKCPKVFLELEEGKFSCYIDPLKGIMAPSSFGTPDQEVPLDLDLGSEEIKKIFSRF